MEAIYREVLEELVQEVLRRDAALEELVKAGAGRHHLAAFHLRMRCHHSAGSEKTRVGAPDTDGVLPPHSRRGERLRPGVGGASI
jgi:hypothetical protein